MIAIKPDPFYDRSQELRALDDAWSRHGNNGRMMLLYGRRRLGKTYLLQRYFAGGVTGNEPARPCCYYLAEQTSASVQRGTLARQVLSSLPSLRTTENEIAVSWNTLLGYVTRQVATRNRNEGRFALVLDEFPYLVDQTPELPSMIQAWWDQEGVHAPLFVVLCGSQLSAMASLGHESAPLFGRFDAGIHRLEPMTYYDTAAFYAENQRYSVEDTLTMYGALGGTPRYHALVDPSRLPAEEIVTLLMQPRAVLENEVRFLLSSERIRDPSPYNAVLEAIAHGETQFGGIQSMSGIERGRLSFYIQTLRELGWIWREYPYGDRSDRRALYRIADPFLAFWYRFVAPLASELQFSDPNQVFASRVAGALPEYMGSHVFEEICGQWLKRYARQHFGIVIRNMGRYWSRDGRTEIDIMADLDTGGFLFCECEWRSRGALRASDYIDLKARVASLPEARWRDQPTFMLFTVGSVSEELAVLAADPSERLFLVAGQDLLPEQLPSPLLGA